MTLYYKTLDIHKNNNTKNTPPFKHLLYLGFFLLGFDEFILYTPIILLLTLRSAWPKNNNLAKKPYIYTQFLFFTAALLPLFIGFNETTIPAPYKTAISLIISVTIAGFVFYQQEQKIKQKLLICFVLGMGLEAMTIAFYSYITDPINYGYGLLYNPLTRQTQNSPLVSNALSLTASILLYWSITLSNTIKKTFSITLLIFSLGLALFLGGRTFFIILIISFFITIAFSVNTKKTLFFLTLLILSALTVLSIQKSNYKNQYISNVTERFSHISDNVRFKYLSSGLKTLADHPFGGFKLEEKKENWPWFHNVFLDNARLGGWIPFLSLGIIFLTAGIKLTRNKTSRSSSLYIIFISASLLMQQDVILEGDYRYFTILFFCLMYAFNDLGQNTKASEKSCLHL